jgi:hypothetical protein
MKNEIAEDYSDNELETFAGIVGESADSGKLTGVLDTAYTNGGHARFVQSLQEESFEKIASYAGWNTASNSLGTVLGQLSCASFAAENGLPLLENQNFTYERYLDDCLYQTLIRPEINEELTKAGINVLNLGDEKSRVEAMIRRKFEPFVKPGLSLRVSLPWPRTFEALIEAERVAGK